MVRFASAVLTLMLAVAPARAADLSLADIVNYHRSGVGDTVLIEFIEANGAPFILSMADIQFLRDDGFSERVITALIRHSRRVLEAAAPAETVVVAPQITTIVPIIVVDADEGRHGARRPHPGPGDRNDRDDSSDGHRKRRDHADRTEPPPATWTTRREDGRNVSDGQPVRSDAPAATWVTPSSTSKRSDEGQGEGDKPSRPRP